jgi:hypothetical protein
MLLRHGDGEWADSAYGLDVGAERCVACILPCDILCQRWRGNLLSVASNSAFKRNEFLHQPRLIGIIPSMIFFLRFGR